MIVYYAKEWAESLRQFGDGFVDKVTSGKPSKEASGKIFDHKTFNEPEKNSKSF